MAMTPTPIPTPPARVNLLDGHLSLLDWITVSGTVVMMAAIVAIIVAVRQVRNRHKPEEKAEQVLRFGRGKLKERYDTLLGELPAGPAPKGLVDEEPTDFSWSNLWRRSKAKKAKLAAAQAARPVVYDDVLGNLWAELDSDALPILRGFTQTKETTSV